MQKTVREVRDVVAKVGGIVEATSKSSERTANRLTLATWVLAGATIALVLVTAVLAYATFRPE